MLKAQHCFRQHLHLPLAQANLLPIHEDNPLVAPCSLLLEERDVSYEWEPVHENIKSFVKLKDYLGASYIAALTEQGPTTSP